MAPLSAHQLRQHPEYPHIIWPLKPASHGKVPVAKDRGGPCNIAYEVHGHGPRHLVVSGSIALAPACAAYIHTTYTTPEACASNHVAPVPVSFQLHRPSQIFVRRLRLPNTLLASTATHAPKLTRRST